MNARVEGGWSSRFSLVARCPLMLYALDLPGTPFSIWGPRNGTNRGTGKITKAVGNQPPRKTGRLRKTRNGDPKMAEPIDVKGVQYRVMRRKGEFVTVSVGLECQKRGWTGGREE